MSPCLCPDCGAPLQIVTDGIVGRLYATRRRDPPHYTYQREPAPFGACPRCEFCIEIRSCGAKDTDA